MHKAGLTQTHAHTHTNAKTRTLINETIL